VVVANDGFEVDLGFKCQHKRRQWECLFCLNNQTYLSKGSTHERESVEDSLTYTNSHNLPTALTRIYRCVEAAVCTRAFV